jgi:hypothetical protein
MDLSAAAAATLFNSNTYNPPNFDYLFVHRYIPLNKIDGLIDRMSQQKGPFKCEACGTEFNSHEELAYHEKYSTYRRPGCCWQ